MWLRIHVDAISAFKDIKDHLEMQRLVTVSLVLLYRLNTSSEIYASYEYFCE